MDLTDPTQAVTPTLDGPILAVLARAGRPLTVGEVAAESARGSEIGIRRTLARLVDQGIVRATAMGRNTVHELNRDHVAAPAAEQLAGLRLELWRRLRETLAGWRHKPRYACVFGSAARGDGGPESDIDILLVRPATLQMFLGLIAPALRPETTWEEQVDELRVRVHGWTGNRVQVVDLSAQEWQSRRNAGDELIDEIDRHAIVLVNEHGEWWKVPSPERPE